MVIKYSHSKNEKSIWLCQCECEEKCFVATYDLNSGRTRSCGCLQKEKAKEAATRQIWSRKHIDPKMASAKKIWKKRYSDGCPFETFLSLSQKSCWYCGVLPFTTFNVFVGKNGNNHSEVSSDWAREAYFTYNGLDRIDPFQNHNANNVISCCYLCNKAKNDMTLEQFREWLIRIFGHFLNNKNKMPNIQQHTFGNIGKNNRGKYINPIISSANRVWRDRYQDGCSFKEFLFLSQERCYYCDVEPKNIYNAYINKKGEMNTNVSSDWAKQAYFNYNGIDRIDSNKGHRINNIVPCCIDCNKAKLDMSIEDFRSWLIQLHDHFIIGKETTNYC